MKDYIKPLTIMAMILSVAAGIATLWPGEVVEADTTLRVEDTFYGTEYYCQDIDSHIEINDSIFFNGDTVTVSGNGVNDDRIEYYQSRPWEYWFNASAHYDIYLDNELVDHTTPSEVFYLHWETGTGLPLKYDIGVLPNTIDFTIPDNNVATTFKAVLKFRVEGEMFIPDDNVPVAYHWVNIGPFISTATATASIIDNYPPTATITAEPTEGQVPLTVLFTGSGSDVDGAIAGYEWDFGDGSDTVTGRTTTSHTFEDTGFYTVRFTVIDDDNSIGIATVNITANTVGENIKPSLSISADSTGGKPPLTVNFSATASDPDGSIESYFWDFGDGSTSTIAKPSHTFQSEGTYGVTCTVRDNEFATTTDTIEIVASETWSPDFIGKADMDNPWLWFFIVIGLIAAVFVVYFFGLDVMAFVFAVIVFVIFLVIGILASMGMFSGVEVPS